ncbi:hypothetical protein Taro_047431 [Colocasia esculenta]|uniref:Uncharacterized protein n=1 Tax=Colocasia esculenta TaxID=4460 RepID=A0A843X7X4_COLES|nr:hypothetical protein [Colocasia esculenta]
MEVSAIPRAVSCRPFKAATVPGAPSLRPDALRSCSCTLRRRLGCSGFTGIRAIEGSSDLPPVEVTWQIAVGALAGVTPFVVAGIEFSKRIVS